MVLLEAEEAKAALALLRAKADQWIASHELVVKMLSHAKRNPATFIVDPECKAERLNLERAGSSFGDAMNVSASLRLDDELKAAYLRAENANSRKKELGFN